MFIKEAEARSIKDSRGERTIEIEIESGLGVFKASAPAGKSKGSYETPAYSQRGFEWSLKLAKKFCSKLKGKNFPITRFSDLENFERLIKSFESNYEKFGANATYALETAFLKAAAANNRKQLWEFIKGDRKIKVPMPVGNCIGGGMHSGDSKERKPDFQEFLLIPKEETFMKAVSNNIHAYEFAEKLLKKKESKWVMKKNDESALKTELSNEDVLETLSEITKKFGSRIGIDAASSTFFHGNYYNYKNKELTRNNVEQEEYIRMLIEKYNLFYVEDPFQEEDFSGFAELMKHVKNGALIVGDDLTVTHFERIKRAVEKKCVNAVIIKPNQNGYIMDVARIIEYCKEKKIKIILSHRSGETMDNALADYAIGFQADFIKTGIMGRERLVKLKRIMDIEVS